MSTVRKATFLSRWTTQQGEQFLSLHGPKGSVQHVELSGDAHSQIDRAELLAALEQIAGYPHIEGMGPADIGRARTIARSAIAKAKGDAS